MNRSLAVGLVLLVAGVTVVLTSKASADEPAGAATKPATMDVFGPQTDWPRFRGPMGNGVTAEKGLPTKWDAKTGENIRWSADLPTYTAFEKCPPCHVYASPMVYKDRVFVSLSRQGDTPHQVPPKHKLVCFNKSDGKMLWETEIEPGPNRWGDPAPHANEWSYSSSTPCTDGNRVYVSFESNVIAAVDYQGKMVWRSEEIAKGVKDPGVTSSPVLYKNLVLQKVRDELTAFDRTTGECKYHQHYRSRGIYGCDTPVPVLLNGAPVYLMAPLELIYGVNPEDGRVVWSVNQGTWQTGAGASMALGDGVACSVLFQCGVTDNRSATALDLDALAGAQGDVTKTAVKWVLPKQGRGQGESGAQFASPVIAGGYLYQLYRGELWCIEVASGKKVYAEKVETEREGSDKGFPTFASPVATADGLVYFASAAHTFVVKGGPKFEVLAINELGDVGRGNQGPYFFTSAAVSEGQIFILGEKKLWCIGKKEPAKD